MVSVIEQRYNACYCL